MQSHRLKKINKYTKRSSLSPISIKPLPPLLSLSLSLSLSCFFATNPKYLFHLSFLYNNLHTYFYKIPYSSSIHSTRSTLKQLFTIFLHNTYFSIHVSITLKTTLNSMTTSHIILKFEGITSMKNTPTRMQKLRFEG